MHIYKYIQLYIYNIKKYVNAPEYFRTKSRLDCSFRCLILEHLEHLIPWICLSSENSALKNDLTANKSDDSNSNAIKIKIIEIIAIIIYDVL